MFGAGSATRRMFRTRSRDFKGWRKERKKAMCYFKTKWRRTDTEEEETVIV
jgi:hypothetical protein